MKKITLLILLLITVSLFAGYKYRLSESAIEPQEIEYLQGGILVRWDVQMDSTMYKYKEMWLPENTSEVEVYEYINYQTKSTKTANQISNKLGTWKVQNRKLMLKNEPKQSKNIKEILGDSNDFKTFRNSDWNFCSSYILVYSGCDNRIFY